jgi:hypothetical protein
MQAPDTIKRELRITGPLVNDRRVSGTKIYTGLQHRVTPAVCPYEVL